MGSLTFSGLRRWGPEVLLAAALVTLGQLDVWLRLAAGPYHGPRALSSVIAAVAGLAVLWRARAPLMAMGVVIVVVSLSRPFFAHDTSFPQGFLPLVILTASAAYYRSGRPAL